MTTSVSTGRSRKVRYTVIGLAAVCVVGAIGLLVAHGVRNVRKAAHRAEID